MGMTWHQFRKGLAIACSALAYLACLLAWLFAIIMYLPGILVRLDTMTAPAHTMPAPARTVDAVSADSPLLLLFGIIVTIIVIIGTVYMLARLPGAIVRSSEQVIAKGATSLTPLVIRSMHKRPTKRRYKLVVAKLTTTLRLLLMLAPLPIVVISGWFSDNPLYAVFVIITVAFTLCSLTLFGCSRLLSPKAIPKRS